ncbi:MAG TPA: BamA/TamA family outer membrane protein [Bryobacteraceae bacterium]|nr:BamA/TamA family outer membrane protein [Bryobacteraceae bacterium]
MLALGLAGAVSHGIAQVSQFEGQRIVEITFSPSQPLDPADLATAQPLKVGEPLRATDVSHAIDGLFASGRFDDIAVEAEAATGGVHITFVVKNTWFVGGISIDGKVSQSPNRGQVTSAARFSLGEPFHDQDVTNGAASIQKLFESNGLYEATVTPAVQRDPQTQQAFVTFTVKEHKRAKYEAPIVQDETPAGEAKLSNNTILRATGWRVPIIHFWRHVTNTRTRNGVRGLRAKYESKDRLKAKVELTKLDYDAQRRRVQPNLTVDPGPRVTVKAVETKISKRRLKRYVPVFQERTVDNDLLVEGKRNLSDYFQSQGYYDVTVDFRVLPPQKDLQSIEYVIARGERYKLVSLVIQGNHYFDTQDIRERMYLEPASFQLRHGRFSDGFLRKDQQDIESLYQSNGFRDVKVSAQVDRDYKGKTGDVRVTVNIEEGQQWFVDHLAIQGINQFNPDELKAQLVSAAGQAFADANLANDRDFLLTYYYSHGFPKATFQAAWKPGATAHHVDVNYTIKEGDREFVRGVLTSGLKTTRQGYVDKRITLKPGDPLSPLQETAIQKDFYDLGTFARVDTAVQNPEGDEQHKYVLYNFEEADRYTFTVGIGAQVARFGTPSSTSLSSPAGTTGFSPEFSLNVSRLNFLGIGHVISTRFVYSSIEKRGSISYLQPRFLNKEGRNITYSILYDQTLDVRTFAAKREEGSIQFSQKFSKSLTGLFRFAYRRVSVSDVVIPVLLVPQLLQPVRIGMFAGNIAQDRRDNPADPHKGIYNTADFGVAGHFFGSDRSFGRLLLRNATYYSLTKNLVLARQTQFGVIVPFAAPVGVSAQESVPLPERFFAGGADSLRAFPYNEAGPRDTGAPLVPGGPVSQPTGFPLGGNALFVNNVELRFPFIGQNIQGVVFHDMGNVYDSVENISLRFHQKDMKDFNYGVQAAGLGIRYKTPVGPIRADLAYSINPPSFVGFKGTPQQLLGCNPNVPPAGVCVGVPQSISHFQFFFSIGQTF